MQLQAAADIVRRLVVFNGAEADQSFRIESAAGILREIVVNVAMFDNASLVSPDTAALRRAAFGPVVGNLAALQHAAFPQIDAGAILGRGPSALNHKIFPSGRRREVARLIDHAAAARLQDAFIGVRVTDRKRSIVPSDDIDPFSHCEIPFEKPLGQPDFIDARDRFRQGLEQISAIGRQQAARTGGGQYDIRTGAKNHSLIAGDGLVPAHLHLRGSLGRVQTNLASEFKCFSVAYDFYAHRDLFGNKSIEGPPCRFVLSGRRRIILVFVTGEQ